MGERLFEPTATKMATISSDKAASATPRERHHQTSQPPKSSQDSTADAGREWSGPNRPDRSQDPHISARHPPHREDFISFSWKAPSGTTKTPADDSSGSARPGSLWEEEKALCSGPRTCVISSQPPAIHRMHLDPPDLQEEEEQQMPSCSISAHDSALGIERMDDNTDLWASPMAHSSMDESRASTTGSTFYFTAASKLTTSTQDSFWGLESNDGCTVDEIEDHCSFTTTGPAVENKQDHQIMALQLLEILDKLEMDSSWNEDNPPTRMLRDSNETQSCGSEESWQQERIHSTLQFKYKPINAYFERKSTTQTNHTSGTHTAMN
jgi:hypothetical protein